MNTFDTSVISMLNQFARRSDGFDHLVLFIADEPLLKGGILVVFLWIGWTYPCPEKATKREAVLATLYAIAATLVFTKVVRYFLPFRLRPLHHPDLAFQLPSHVSAEALWNWSSFPSDTAAMLFALSAGLMFISKRMGIIAMLYSFVLGCLPRIYLGYHYPTDIIAGALIGVIGALVMNSPFIRQPLANIPLIWSRQNPAVFYPVFFLITYETANIFENSRRILTFLVHWPNMVG